MNIVRFSLAKQWVLPYHVEKDHSWNDNCHCNAPVNVMPVGWGYNLGDSDEKHFNTLGILTWPYFLILTMGNSDNFVTKVDRLVECRWFWHPTMTHVRDSDTILLLCQSVQGTWLLVEMLCTVSWPILNWKLF